MAKLGELAEFGKNATEILISFTHYMLAENTKTPAKHRDILR